MNRLDKVVNSLPNDQRDLNLTIVYEDAHSWRWARAACDQIEGLLVAERKIVFQLRFWNRSQRFSSGIDRSRQAVSLDVA